MTDWTGGYPLREDSLKLNTSFVVALLHLSGLVQKCDVPLNEQDVAVVAHDNDCRYARAVPSAPLDLTVGRRRVGIRTDDDRLDTSRPEKVLCRCDGRRWPMRQSVHDP